MNLNEIAVEEKCAKSMLGYPPIYEKMFDSYRARQSGNLFEIGVQFGASMRMWRRWFPENWNIIGIDTDEDCAKYAVPDKRVFVEYANATYPEPMSKLNDKYGGFDIVIDDGGHGQRDQLKSFEILWNMVLPGGIYVVEDLCCAYSDFFLQELPKGELCRKIFNFSEQMHQKETLKTTVVKAVHWYPSLVFIEKR
jgi:predicted O-methyltransferase YrrM